MITFSFSDKNDFTSIAPAVFNILADKLTKPHSTQRLKCQDMELLMTIQ